MKLLDCTMRDGGYYNGWWFSSDFTRDYLNACTAAEVDAVEFGFRFRKAEALGRFAVSKPASLEPYRYMRDHLEIGVMVNAAEFNDLCDIDLLMPGRELDVISFVRIAVVLDLIGHAALLADRLLRKGYDVHINVMRCSELEQHDLQGLVETIGTLPLKSIYFADSFGCCTPDQIHHLFGAASGLLDTSLGIHVHDNRGLAMANVEAAVSAGCEWVDGTFLGMGRGPGNARTELLAERYKRNDVDLKKTCVLQTFVDTHMWPLLTTYRWGASAIYHYAADSGLHPTPVQKALDSYGSCANTLQAAMTRISLGPDDLAEAVSVEKKGCCSIGETLKTLESFSLEKVILFPGTVGLRDYYHEVKSLKEKGYLLVALNLPAQEKDCEFLDFIFCANPTRLVANLTRHNSLDHMKAILIIDADMDGLSSFSTDSNPCLKKAMYLKRSSEKCLESCSTFEFFLDFASQSTVKEVYFLNFEGLPFSHSGNDQSVSDISHSYTGFQGYCLSKSSLPYKRISIFELI